MKDETKRRIHLVYSIVLSILLVVSGILLIVACVGIYRSGDKPFSPNAVAAAFSGIAVPVYLCLALVIGGFVLDGFFPGAKRKLTPQKQNGVILARLHKKLDLSKCGPSLAGDIQKLQSRRKLHKHIGLVLLAVCAGVFLSYGLNSQNFHQSQINESMSKAMQVFLPCLAIPFGYSVWNAYYANASMSKEIELVKQAIAAGCKAEATDAPTQAVRRVDYLTIARYGLLATGIFILLFGFFSGGTKDVLTKAINICTECVGLG